MKINKIKKRYNSVKEANTHAQEILFSINQKLKGGWSPFFVGENSRLYEKLSAVCEKFIAEKEKTLRKNTLRSYKSVTNQLIKWVNENEKNIYFSMFRKFTAVSFMDFIFAKERVGGRTYNNILKVLRLLWNWAVEKCYAKENPFEQIKLKPKTQKKRILVPPETRQIITEYLNSQNNTGFNIACRLVYTSLIRPKEILELRIKDVDLKNRCICVPSEVAKNHKQRYSALNQELITLLENMNLDKYPKNYFLFGGDLAPSATPAGNSRLTKEWDKLRKALKLPAEMQLYSLRDSGIYEMLKSGIDDLSVMQHADHSDLSITTIYANHADSGLISKIYEKAPKF
jgi:integrase